MAVIDVEMPEMSGLNLVHELRERGVALPVLMLSGRATVEDRVAGLSRGADDYLIKPFAPEELVARVQALLRKHQRTEPAVTTVQMGLTVVDLEAKVATVAGEPVRLTKTECEIVALLARNRGRPVAREKMLEQVWGYTYLPETRTLDTHIWRLRRKLGDTAEDVRWIENISGVGYQLNPPAPASANGEAAPA